MEAGAGLGELSRSATAYLACVAFVVGFLATVAFGGTVLTGALRGGIATAVVLVFGRLLVRPLLATVLDALARDRAASQGKDGGP